MDVAPRITPEEAAALLDAADAADRAIVRRNPGHRDRRDEDQSGWLDTYARGDQPAIAAITQRIDVRRAPGVERLPRPHHDRRLNARAVRLAHNARRPRPALPAAPLLASALDRPAMTHHPVTATRRTTSS
jgi:hypothetical protein